MLTEFLVALQFLTIIRVRKILPFDEYTLGRAGIFFPLVGLLLGLVLWGLDQLLSFVFTAPLVNVLLVAALASLSRGLHLDGVADSADGLWGSADRQRSLTIMKDSRIGTFGALTLLIVILLKLRALDLLVDGARTQALLSGPMFGRWACVLMAYSAPPARPEGLGATFVRGTRLRELSLATMIALSVSFFLAAYRNVFLLVFLGGLALAISRYCTYRLGGVTGDTLGAVGEVVETAALCCLTLSGSSGGQC